MYPDKPTRPKFADIAPALPIQRLKPPCTMQEASRLAALIEAEAGATAAKCPPPYSLDLADIAEGATVLKRTFRGLTGQCPQDAADWPAIRAFLGRIEATTDDNKAVPASCGFTFEKIKKWVTDIKYIIDSFK